MNRNGETRRRRNRGGGGGGGGGKKMVAIDKSIIQNVGRVTM